MENKLVRGINGNKTIKVTAIYSPDLVDEARKIHKTTPTATAALGRTLMAGVMIAASMKNERDALTVHIDGNGPLGKILVTGKNDGHIKGYVQNPRADHPLKDNGKLDVSGIVGNEGVLTIVMDLGLKEPYVGKVSLLSGEIADDFANYFVQSDQVPSAVALGVLVERDQSVKTAGGFIVQMMPGVSEEEVDQVEKMVRAIGSVTDYFKEGKSPEDLIHDLLQGQDPEILEERPVSYACDCSREKVEDSLLSLGTEELEAMKKENGEAEVNCYFCNTSYQFDSEDLTDLITRSKNLKEE